jgi:hypothetical protein
MRKKGEEDTLHIYSTCGSGDATGMDEAVTTLNLEVMQDRNKDEMKNQHHEYNVELDIAWLRNSVSMCKALKAKNVTLQVHEGKAGGSQRDDDDPTKPSTIFTIKVEGESGCTQRRVETDASSADSVRPITQASGEERKDKTELDPKKYALACEEMFNAEYINNFLKSMEKSSVAIRLGSGKPLFLTYALDASGSFVCFILAPIFKGEGE